jgi:hypothetical protein
MLELAEQLDQRAAKLTLKQRFIYAQALVDTRTESQLQAFLDWSSSHALTGKAGTPWFLQEVDGHSRLDRMEQALRACTLWLWLDLRFASHRAIRVVHGDAHVRQRLRRLEPPDFRGHGGRQQRWLYRSAAVPGWQQLHHGLRGAERRQQVAVSRRRLVLGRRPLRARCRLGVDRCLDQDGGLPLDRSSCSRRASLPLHDKDLA